MSSAQIFEQTNYPSRAVGELTTNLLPGAIDIARQLGTNNLCRTTMESRMLILQLCIPGITTQRTAIAMNPASKCALVIAADQRRIKLLSTPGDVIQ